MAYMTQENKKEIAAKLKTALKGVNIKYSLSVRHHSTIVMSVKSSDIDFIGNFNENNRDRDDRVADGYLSPSAHWVGGSRETHRLELCNNRHNQE